MVILGFLAGHDSNACLINNEKILAYSNAERSDRLKRSSSYIEAIKNLLTTSGIKIDDIKEIALTNTQGNSLTLENKKLFDVMQWENNPDQFTLENPIELINKANSKEDSFKPIPEHAEGFPVPVAIKCNNRNKLNNLKEAKEKLDLKSFIRSGKFSFYGKQIKGYFVEHHFAHAVSALIRNPDMNIAISLDGAGHSFSLNRQYPYFAGISIAKTNKGILLGPAPFFLGGVLYSWASKTTQMSEGKVMGLSSYFNIKNVLKIADKDWITCLNLLENLFEFDSSNDEFFQYEDIYYKSKYRDIMFTLVKHGKKYLKLDNTLINSRVKKNLSLPSESLIIVSGVTQEIFSRLYKKEVSRQINFFNKNGVETNSVILTGGCALNCPSNRIISEDILTSRFTFDNACNDEGLSIGAAYAKLFITNKGYLSSIKTGPFIGGYISAVNEAIELASIDNSFIVENFTTNEFTATKIVEYLVTGNAIVLAHGRYESGPRALGNRSLIGLAELESTHWKLNQIKKREQWRPIAPMVRDIDFNEFFEGPMDSHMLMTNTVKNPSKLPGTTHIDNSARVQVVKDKSHLTWLILKKLKERGFAPVIANTSLNQAGEPLINSATRVINLMKENTEIRAAYIDNFLFTRQ